MISTPCPTTIYPRSPSCLTRKMRSISHNFILFQVGVARPPPPPSSSSPLLSPTATLLSPDYHQTEHITPLQATLSSSPDFLCVHSPHPLITSPHSQPHLTLLCPLNPLIIMVAGMGIVYGTKRGKVKVFRRGACRRTPKTPPS